MLPNAPNQRTTILQQTDQSVIVITEQRFDWLSNGPDYSPSDVLIEDYFLGFTFSNL